ncbi:MAG: hypothetical protein ACOZNI_19625 [Myxococcota bacterium]
MLLLLAHLALAACPSKSVDVDTALDDAEAAFTAMETDRFRASVDLATEEVACLTDRPQRATVARLHRMAGLRAFVVEKDNARATSAFAAARAIESAYAFPVTLIPAKHPVAQLYASAADPGTVDSAPTPASGHLEFDGRPGSERPMTRPVLVQVVAEDGSVTSSAYLWPGTPLPYYDVARAITKTVAPPTSPVRKARKGPNVPLAIVAGASLVGAGVLYGVNYQVNQSYWDPATPETDLDTLKAKNNALVIADVGVGLLAVGAGIGAVVAGHW